MGLSGAHGFELAERGIEVPAEADFGITLIDNAMEPYFPKGTLVYITSKQLPREFQAGLFFYEGRVVCRQWCEDYSGAILLLCANRQANAQDIIIPSPKKGKCLCLGSVLTDIILPPP